MRLDETAYGFTPGGSASAIRGFTLLEVVITVAVLAILTTLAVPSFELVRNTSLLAATSNDLSAGVQLARTEAIRRGVPVSICSSTDGTTCAGGTGPWTGWLVYADINRNATLDVADERLQAGVFNTRTRVTPSTSITGAGNRITFGSTGMARASGGSGLLAGHLSICVSTTRPANNVRRVTLGSGGRVALETASSGGTCT